MNDNKLDKISTDLEELKSIIILLNQDALEEKRKELLQEGSVKKQIYDLCDGTKSISDIASIIGKDNSYVRSYLSRLRREGLIRKIEKDGEIYHEQIF